MANCEPTCLGKEPTRSIVDDALARANHNWREDETEQAPSRQHPCSLIRADALVLAGEVIRLRTIIESRKSENSS